MFFDEPGTEKTWIAVVQDRCFAETCDEDAILSDWYSTAASFFHRQDGIDFGMFHIAFDPIRGRIPRIDVHRNNILTVINDTEMTMVVLVQTTFMDFAQV